jgi:ADP-dependent NAD(P)H-hydrate dehydratase / NAD(P)H-hydrate epimerase
MYLVTADDMREMDRRTIENFGIPGIVLMENAGRGAARVLFEKFEDLKEKRVGVVAGRGNNGGDGFVIARYLAQKGIRVTVYLLAKKDMVKGDAGANLHLLEPLQIPVIELPDQQTFSTREMSFQHEQVWVDAILGTGLKSDVKDYFKMVIETINHTGKPVFAVDIPSGLNSETGLPCGACIRAKATATFAFPKIGHLLTPGASYTGSLDIIDIGIPAHIADQVDPRQSLLVTEIIRKYFEPRAPNAHKGDTGHLIVAAGAPGKTGAAAMTAISAMRSGAGLVTLCVPNSLNPVLEAQVLEAMTFPLSETGDGVLKASSYDDMIPLLADKKCLAVGPGIGTAEETKKFIHRVIRETTIPIVIDADGLNCLAENVNLLKDLKAPAILTPHPGEMARLWGTSTAGVQKDRIACARRFAEEFNVHVVLKGAGTVIAQPDGRVFVNPTGNPGMASGGMGDVLTGMIAGFVVQGFPIGAAIQTGVFLHGAAADALERNYGPFGYLASDVMRAIPEQINDLISGQLSLYAAALPCL